MPGIESPAYTSWNVKTFQFTSFAWVKPFWMHASGEGHRRISHDTCKRLTNEVSAVLSSPVGLHEIGERWEEESAFIGHGRVELTKEGKTTENDWQSRKAGYFRWSHVKWCLRNAWKRWTMKTFDTTENYLAALLGLSSINSIKQARKSHLLVKMWVFYSPRFLWFCDICKGQSDFPSMGFQVLWMAF